VSVVRILTTCANFCSHCPQRSRPSRLWLLLPALFLSATYIPVPGPLGRSGTTACTPHVQLHLEFIVWLSWYLMIYTDNKYNIQQPTLRGQSENGRPLQIYQRELAIYVHILMVDSTKVLCPVFDKIEILIPGDAPIFSHLWTKFGILICYRNEEKWLYWSSSSNLSGCAKALCPFHSCTKVLSPAADVILRPVLLLYEMHCQ